MSKGETESKRQRVRECQRAREPESQRVTQLQSYRWRASDRVRDIENGHASKR